MGSLASGSGLEQVFSQKGVRAFPPSGAFSPTAATPAKELFVRGVAKYLGLGEAAADRRAGMLWIEAAASRADADAILFLALHHDAGVYYEESKPTAWAFYSLARILDGDSPIGLARLGRLNESGVQTDWMGLPELLHGYMVKGKISTQIVAGLSDLSLYRSLESAPPAKASKTVPIHAVSPSENAEIRELARTALATKLKVLDLSQSDELICGKFKDRDGEAAYMVSGILSHSADSGAVLTVPFTACFRVSKGASGPELYYCSAGRFHHGMLRSGY
jgi:hypothetical protein